MSTRDHILRTLAAAMPEVARDFGVSAMSLFGSIARGDDFPGSDADVLVEFDRIPTLFTMARVQRRLEEVLGCAVDIGTPDTLRDRIRDEIMREAIRVA